MISIIIPTLNEAKALPATLQRVFDQEGNFEVIVVDGGSSDATIKFCENYETIKIIKAKQGRASQMNAGAAIAKGEWLVF